MTAKEAINYLDKPVSFKNIPSLRLNIDDGVYILSEIQQNWRNEGGRRRIKSQFLISDIINPCVGYWVKPETVTEFNGEIEIDAEAALRKALNIRERHELYKARTFGTDEERTDAEGRIRRIQAETMDKIKAAIAKSA